MNFRSFDSYLHFAAEVTGQRRYIRTQVADDFLKALQISAPARQEMLAKGMKYYRAQEGRADYAAGAAFPLPHSAERMKPRYNQAREGRANSTGIPHLYLATEAMTAILEIRPALGLHVTVAEFHLRRDLKVINCAKTVTDGVTVLLPGSPEPSPDECAANVWSQIDSAFSEPWVRDEVVPGYVPTQIISELFRSLNYDGIIYKSAFGSDAHNIVLFDIQDADYVKADVVCVSDMTCTWRLVSPISTEAFIPSDIDAESAD